MFLSKSLDKVNKKGGFFINLPFINGLKPLKNMISQKQDLAK
jgi:hypothetical protein